MIAPGAISPFNRYIAGVGGAGITDFIYYDPASAYVDNASITNRGTSGTNAVGYSGKSYDFDGVSDYADTGQTLAIDYDDTFVYNAWVKFDTTGASISILSNRENTAEARGILFYRRNTDKLACLITNKGNTPSQAVIFCQGNSLLSANIWYYVELSYDGSGNASGVGFKVNGVDETVEIITDNLGTNTIISTSNLFVGATAEGTSTFFNGQISDCSITINGTLTHQFEFNQASSTGIFDSYQSVLATNSGAALIEGLSGLENSETHNGIPQSFSKNWNRYDEFNGTNFYISGSDANLPSGATIRTIEVDFLYTPSAGAFRSIFDYGTVGTGTRCHIYYNNSSVYFDLGSSAILCNLSALNANEINTIECVTGATRDDCTIKINGVLQSVTTSNPNTNVNTTLGQYTIGAAVSAANFFDGLVERVRVWSDATKTTKVFDITNVSEWVDSVNAANGTRNGTVNKILIPENPASLGNDIFANAIVDAQPKFKLDGDSYLEGEVLTINYNTAFEVEFDVVFYGLGSVFDIVENLDGAAGFRGLAISKVITDEIQFYLSNNLSTNVYLVVSTNNFNPSINTSYSCKITYNGTGLAIGVVFTVNDVELTKAVAGSDTLGSNTTVTTNPLNIGRRQSDDSRNINGSITNFKFNYL